MGRRNMIPHQAEEERGNENFDQNRCNTRSTKRSTQNFSNLRAHPSRFRPSFQENFDKTSKQNILMQRREHDFHADRAEMSLQNHANRIVSKMEEDIVVMGDKVESEMFTKETLKHMTQSLTVKRYVKRKLTESFNVQPKGRPIGLWKRMKYRTSMKYSQMKVNLKNMVYTFELWYSSLKKIEGHFGSSTSSYFKFLRWLFLMNVSTMFVALLFIVLPDLLSENFMDVTENMKDYDVWDVFTGEGSFTNTILFYGNYSNQAMNLFGFAYNMPCAYFYTMLFLYVVSVLILGFSVARSYRKSFIQAEEGIKNVFIHKIFCGWDYSIATQKAAELKSEAIYIELKELLSEVIIKNTDVRWTRRVKIIFIRFVTNIVICITIALIGGLLWFLKEMYKLKYLEQPLFIAFVANLLNVIIPMLFTYVASYENYRKQSHAVGITLIRSFLLSTVIVGTLVIFWLTNSFDNECWETSLGQEIYRLIISDFLITLVIHFGHLVYFLIKGYVFKSPVVIEFDVASNTLDLIYNQSLFWVGFYFSPLLSVVVSIKLFLSWYLKKYYILKVCQPSTKAWRASQTRTWFLTLTFLTALATTYLMGFIITKIPPTNCGPFQGNKYFYDVVVEIFNENSFPPLMYIGYFMKPAVVTLIIIALCVQVYYVKQKANGERDVVEKLRNMIQWESRDKKFLLERISRITKGEWQYNIHDGRDEDPYTAVPKMETNHNSSFDIGISTSRNNLG